VAPVAEARPSLPAAPAAQVAAVVAPVLQGPDGSYRVTMHLQPEALGHVAVTVDLHEGSVSLHLHAAESGTGDLLRDSLDDLRAELDRQGLSMGTLDVSTGDRGPQERAAQELHRPANAADRRESAPAAALPTPSISGRPSALDVQL
jgi:flagellar hook-length control protein FliK